MGCERNTKYDKNILFMKDKLANIEGFSEILNFREYTESSNFSLFFKNCIYVTFSRAHVCTPKYIYILY